MSFQLRTPNSDLKIPEGRRWCLRLIVTQSTVGSIPTSGAWGFTGAGGLPFEASFDGSNPSRTTFAIRMSEVQFRSLQLDTLHCDGSTNCLPVS